MVPWLRNNAGIERFAYFGDLEGEQSFSLAIAYFFILTGFAFVLQAFSSRATS
jgi:hypothetical protein